MKIWITGATSGVGLATIQEMHKAGHQVMGTSSKAPTQPLETPYPIVKMDLGNADQLPFEIDLALQLHGLPDIVLCNAGIGEIASVEEASMDHARHLFEINYFGHLQLIQTLVPLFRNRQAGHFIFMGSVVYSLCFPFKAQYNASKSALSALALSLRQELLPHSIFVHLLEPGWIRSNFHNRQKALHKENSPYRHRFSHFEDKSRDQNTKYPDGKSLAELILKIIQQPKKYPTRIPVGPDAKLFFLAQRFLPYSWIEKFLLNKY